MEQSKTVQLLIEKFQQFLISSWDKAEIHKDESIKNDWLQVNWELLVEANLFDGGNERVNLNPYGEGADGSSDRVFLSEQEATHNITCKPLSDSELYDKIDSAPVKVPDGGFIFNRFVTVKEDGWYYEEPPFDMFQVEGLDNAAFSIKDAVFDIEKL